MKKKFSLTISQINIYTFYIKNIKKIQELLFILFLLKIFFDFITKKK